MLLALVGLADTDDQRTNAVGVAKTQDAVADNHRDHGIAAGATTVQRADRTEYVFRFEFTVLALQFMRQHIQHQFRIGLRVQVAPVFLDQQPGQLPGIGEIAVVGQANTVRAVDVKRLRLARAGAARGRIAHMANPHVSFQPEHVAHPKDVAHQAIVLALVQLETIAGHDACRILAAMLQNRQRIVNRLVDSGLTDNPDYTTHFRISPNSTTQNPNADQNSTVPSI